jgi:diphthamide synthase (EF-2-diphthine--ammonia ligase)
VSNPRELELRKVLLSWSSGKDSAWALHLLRQQPEVEVVALLTTFNSVADRVAMHVVRRALVELQAERTGLPLWPVELPWPCSNLEYETRMRSACQRATSDGITAVAFGDSRLPRAATPWERARTAVSRLAHSHGTIGAGYDRLGCESKDHLRRSLEALEILCRS